MNLALLFQIFMFVSTGKSFTFWRQTLRNLSPPFENAGIAQPESENNRSPDSEPQFYKLDWRVVYSWGKMTVKENPELEQLRGWIISHPDTCFE